MAMHPSSSFPLLPSDQAEVIRIYLDLMLERYGPGRETVAANTPVGPLNGSNRFRQPGDPYDRDLRKNG